MPSERDDTERDDEDAPRGPLHRNPWVWTVGVVAMVLVALGISVWVGTDALDPEVGDDDTAAFCAELESFAPTAALAGGTDPTGQSLAADARSLEALADVAPDSIQGTVMDFAVATRSLGELLATLEAQEGGDGLAASVAAAEALAAFDRRERAIVTRFSNYASKACGFDWRNAPRRHATPVEPVEEPR